MARDYSARRNRGESAPGRPKRQAKNTARAPGKPRKRAPAAPARGRAGTPGWVWFISGLCLAAALAAGAYIFMRPAGGGSGSQRISIDTPNGAPRAEDDAAGENARSAPSAPEDTPEPRFSFYKMLPNYKVSVSGGDAPAHPRSGAVPDAPAPPHTKTVPEKPTRQSAPPTPAPTSNGSVRADAGPGYVIQAGSFSTRNDADRRKAQLALLGVSADIVDIDLNSGKTVYRVQSEPMVSDSEVEQLVKRLHDNNIDTMVRRAD